MGVAGQLSRGKGVGLPWGLLAQQGPGAKQAGLGVLSTGFGKGSRTQGCSLPTPTGEPRCVCTCSRQLRQLQLPSCWVHRVQFLWAPCEVPELW